MNKDREERIFSVELRVDDTGESKKIVGRSIAYNKMSEDLGGFHEVVRPGSATKTLKEADIRALFNHDPSLILGRNKAGTLRLKETREGVDIEIDPPNTTYANDLLESISRGDVNQMSFGFRTIKDNWIYEEDQLPLRELLEFKLYDVSPVTYPAYQDTKVAVRSLQRDKEKRNESTMTDQEKAKKALELKKRRLELAEKA